MLLSQIVQPQSVKFGMNREGIDNRQLALNIMHWLSGLLSRHTADYTDSADSLAPLSLTNLCNRCNLWITARFAKRID